MTDILVVLETREGALRNASLEAVGAARAAADASGGGKVTALATEQADLDAAQLGGAGADAVLVADAAANIDDESDGRVPCTAVRDLALATMFA